MIYILWEFHVADAHLDEFEKIYASQGEWAMLFSTSEEFFGTTLLKDHQNKSRYLTIDKWLSLDAFENFKIENAMAYNNLDKKCEKLTVLEKMLGVFNF